MTSVPAVVTDDIANHRFVLEQDGVSAELVYRRDGKRLALLHTEVPDAIGGRGVGARLVSAALDRAREDDLTVVPCCPYARAWLRRHPNASAGIAIDWPEGEGPDETRPNSAEGTRDG